MSTKKVNVFQKFEDTNMKRMQLVYLDKHGFEPEEIAKWTDYAISTIKSYIRKYANKLEEACKIFYHITQKAKAVLRGGRQLVYLYKFYYENGELICSKVGTTTRLPEQRLKEEIAYYRKHGIEVGNAEICSVIDCGELPAEGAESYARAIYIQKHPEAFHKNDRFFGLNISVQSFNKIIKGYLGAENAQAPRPGACANQPKIYHCFCAIFQLDFFYFFCYYNDRKRKEKTTMNLFWKVMISIFFLVMFLSDIIKLSDDPKNYRLHLADVVIDVGLMFGFLHLVGVC